MSASSKILSKNVIFLAFSAALAACEHTLEPALFNAIDSEFIEDSFTAARQYYAADDFDLVVTLFNYVVAQDTAYCFEDAYFYLANILLARNNNADARAILLEGRERYSNLGDGGCIPDIIRRFDDYLEQMSPAPSVGLPIFVVYDEPPAPIGGYAAIQHALEYPSGAIDMAVEGRVIVRVLVDCFGHPCMTRSDRSLFCLLWMRQRGER